MLDVISCRKYINEGEDCHEDINTQVTEFRSLSPENFPLLARLV